MIEQIIKMIKSVTNFLFHIIKVQKKNVVFMNKKYFLIRIYLTIMIFLLILCKGSNIKGDFKMSKIDNANVVSKIPVGFISLIEFNNRTGNILRGVIWDNQISFELMDEAKYGIFCIYQTSINNSDYIVKYKEKYYINEAKSKKLSEVAILALEQRQRTYNLGDKVEVQSVDGIVYSVKVVSVEAIETKPFYTDSITTYNIKYVITSNIIENEQIKLIAWVETKQGVKYDELNFIDTETMSVEIRAREKNDKPTAIILRSPEYVGLTYRIVVGCGYRK